MKILLLSAFFLATVLNACAQAQSNENLDSKQAWELIQKSVNDTNFVILDVRTPDEFKSGHIEKAILIDYKSTDFKEKVGKLDVNKTFLVYCRGGKRSASAIEIMKPLGFKNIYHLYLGLEVWKSEGYKITDK